MTISLFICFSLFPTQAFYYPKNAGFPIGTVDTPKSYLLEIHYDNPEGIIGNCTYIHVLCNTLMHY